MTPAICVATLAFARCPVVATFHASGPLDWMRFGLPLWGFLMDRIDYRIAVSERRARQRRSAGSPASTRSSRTACSSRRRADPAAASTASSSSAGTTRARGCTSCCGPGRRSASAPGAVLRIVGADPLAVRLLLSACRRARRRRSRSLGFLSQDELTARAPEREGAGGAVARRGELRHGAHPRVRLRHAGGRVRHRRLPRRHEPGTGGARPAWRTRARWPTPWSSCSRTRSGAPPRRRCARARARALLLGPRSRARLVGDIRAGGGVKLHIRAQPLVPDRGDGRRSRRRRRCCCGGAARTGGRSRTPSRPSSGSGSPWPSGSTCSRSSAAQHRLADRDRPGDGAAAAAVSARLLRLLRRAAGERGPARPDRRARAGGGADAADAAPQNGRWATLVGTVFAHRVFDIVPALLLIVLCARHRGDPRLGADKPDRGRRRSARPSSCSPSFSARRHHRSVLEEARVAEAGRDDGALRARRDARTRCPPPARSSSSAWAGFASSSPSTRR